LFNNDLEKFVLQNDLINDH